MRGGLCFFFRVGGGRAGGGCWLVATSNPADATKLAAFQAKYALPPSLPIYGPWSGKLANDTDRVELYKPDAPNAGITPYILVEAVSYKDSAPWPEGADGTGASLQRRNLAQYGNDPINWAAA